MPPRRPHRVVDERQHDAIAAPPPTAAATSTSRPTTTTTTAATNITAGVVAVPDVASAAPAQSADVFRSGRALPFAIPAAVMQRMPASASASYGSASPLNACEPEQAPHAPSSPAGSVASPTASEVDADIAAQISRRRHRGDGAGGPASADTAPVASAAAQKPLILSNRWNRLRRGAAVVATAESKAGDVAGEGEGEDETPLLAFANATDDLIRFDSRSSRKTGRGGDDAAAATAAEGAYLPGDSLSSSSAFESESSDGDDDGDGIDDDEVLNAAGDVIPNAQDDPALARQIRDRLVVKRRREREREAKLRKQFGRHLAGYDDAALDAQAQTLLQSDTDGDDGDGDEEGEDEEGEAFTAAEIAALTGSGGARGADDEDEEGEDLHDAPPATRARNESGGGFGARQRAPAGAPPRGGQRQQQQQQQRQTGEGEGGEEGFAFPESSPLARRQRFGSVFFETHVSPHRPTEGGGYPCHHTLLCLRGPITVQGPCGLVGFGIGEVAVGGFLLGKKQLVLWNKSERAVMMPVRRLKTKSAEAMELPSMRAAREAVLQKAMGSTTTTTAAAATLQARGGPSSPDEEVADTLVVPTIDPARASTCVRLASQAVHGSPQEGAAPGAVAESAEAHADDEEDEDVNDVEAVFGAIDWDWVQTTLQAWRALFADNLPAIVLAIQPLNLAGDSTRVFHNPMRKHYLHSPKARRRTRQQRQQQQQVSQTQEGDWLSAATAEELGRMKHRDAKGSNGSEGGGGAFVEVPSFISRQAEQNVDVALVPEIVPAVTRQLGASSTGGCVMVVGSQDVGKSTLCRFLANALLSQRGLCYWLDLDLGQPEFGVPGQFALHCVRRPLVRPHDHGSAELVRSFFVGTPTASNPLVVARALAELCGFVATHVARRYPVVVNTHGWVLHTGRRVTVEAVQRLLPRVVVHLVKEREEAWMSDASTLLDPAEGMNADVVARRFLVRDYRNTGAGGNAGNANGKKKDRKGKSQQQQQQQQQQQELLCRLPHATHSRMETGDGARVAWGGIVHTVRVTREKDALRLRAERRKNKGSAGRSALWQAYLSPLIALYEQHHAAGEEARNINGSSIGSGGTTTTLLRAPLSAIRQVVLADADERMDGGAAAASSSATMSPAMLAAALEHRVVALQFTLPSAATTTPPAGPGGVAVCSLDSLQGGFPVTCYGYVEGTERSMMAPLPPPTSPSPAHDAGADGKKKGKAVVASDVQVAIRVPLPQQTVTTLMSLSPCPAISVALSAGTATDTHFMELFP